MSVAGRTHAHVRTHTHTHTYTNTHTQKHNIEDRLCTILKCKKKERCSIHLVAGVSLEADLVRVLDHLPDLLYERLPLALQDELALNLHGHTHTDTHTHTTVSV